MPTFLREGTYRLYFYSHEPNEPPHVHIDRADFSMKAWLDPVTFASNRGFRAQEINAILLLVETHRSRLLEAWNEYFS